MRKYPSVHGGTTSGADIGKANLTPPAEKADWFTLELVNLENTTDEWDLGDSVGVVAAWKYPAAHPPKVTVAAISRRPGGDQGRRPLACRSEVDESTLVGIPVAQALEVDLCTEAPPRHRPHGRRVGAGRVAEASSEEG